MILLHKHTWKEIERFYAPPTSKNVRIEVGGNRTIECLALGVTTIHFICKCEEHKFTEVLGKKV